AANGSHLISALARDAAGNTTTSSTVAVTVANSVVPPGLVAAYGFDEASGSNVTDLTGSGNTGTFGSGVTRTTSGRFGGALVFSGTRGGVTSRNPSPLQLSAGAPLEAWVNASAINSVWTDVVYKGDDNYFLMGSTSFNSRPAAGLKVGSGSG